MRRRWWWWSKRKKKMRWCFFNVFEFFQHTSLLLIFIFYEQKKFLNDIFMSFPCLPSSFFIFIIFLSSLSLSLSLLFYLSPFTISLLSIYIYIYTQSLGDKINHGHFFSECANISSLFYVHHLNLHHFPDSDKHSHWSWWLLILFDYPL